MSICPVSVYVCVCLCMFRPFSSLTLINFIYVAVLFDDPRGMLLLLISFGLKKELALWCVCV